MASGGAERAGAGAQVGVDAAEGVRGREQRLGRLDDDAVVGVDDVGDRHLARSASRAGRRPSGAGRRARRPSARARRWRSARSPPSAGSSPTVIQWVSSSIRGQPGAPPLISSTMRVVVIAPSTAVPQASPSPWR